jgi:WhiB family redox-sensing transcriptional regulator
MTWQSRAACRGLGPALFYPETTGPGTHDNTAAVCLTCVVRPACLDHALRHEWSGFWAGTTGRERRRLRREAGIRLVNPQTIFYDSERHEVDVDDGDGGAAA